MLSHARMTSTRKRIGSACPTMGTRKTWTTKKCLGCSGPPVN